MIKPPTTTRKAAETGGPAVRAEASVDDASVMSGTFAFSSAASPPLPN